MKKKSILRKLCRVLTLFPLVFIHTHTMEKNNQTNNQINSIQSDCFELFNKICGEVEKLHKRYDGKYRASLVQPIADKIMFKKDINLMIKVVKIANVFGKDYILNATTRILVRNLLENHQKVTQDILTGKKTDSGLPELSKIPEIIKQYIVKHIELEKSGIKEEYTIADLINDYFKGTKKEDYFQKIVTTKNFMSITAGKRIKYVVINLSDCNLTGLNNIHKLLDLIENRVCKDGKFKKAPYLLNLSNNYILGNEDPHFPEQLTRNTIISEKIRKVNFNNNQIRTLKSKFYKNLTELEYFYITKNPLSEKTKKEMDKYFKKNNIETSTHRKSFSARKKRQMARSKANKNRIAANNILFVKHGNTPHCKSERNIDSPRSSNKSSSNKIGTPRSKSERNVSTPRSKKFF